jgi:MYXO-CTERM domain-containing protein
MSARWHALLVGLAVATAALPAGAFCRSTTCTKQCPLDENGCKTTGKPLAWVGGCAGMSLQKDGTALLSPDEVRRVMDAALATWSTVQCPGGLANIGYHRLADVPCHSVGFDPNGANANIVMFDDNQWPYQGTDNTLAFTTVTFDPNSGAILGADIEINSAYNILTTSDVNVGYDLQSILTHELGHALGLGHSTDPGATMNPSYERGDTSIRVLGNDDVTAICGAYPATRGAPCDPIPRGGFSSVCPPPTPDFGSHKSCAVADPGHGAAVGAGWALFGATLALGLRRRRRRDIPPRP